ncbi:MAG: hypothetical protein U0798_07635 [Gemmataceae bacterium]
MDTFGLPERNPWNALLRLTGFDFYPDGKRMAVCAWDGDVWAVSGIDKPEEEFDLAADCIRVVSAAWVDSVMGPSSLLS